MNPRGTTMKPWFKVPHALAVNLHRFTPSELRLLLVLLDQQSVGNEQTVTSVIYKDWTGMSQRALQSSLKVLVQKGICEKTLHGGLVLTVDRGIANLEKHS